VVCDPKSLSAGELRRVTRRFIAELGDCIGPHTDIPAPDMYTDEQTMAWVYDTYNAFHPGTNNRAVVTGKPLELGGSYGRRDATARGCLYATDYLLPKLVIPQLGNLQDARVVIQGFGEVGANAAALFQDAGAHIIGVSDASGAITAETGLDLNAVTAHKQQQGCVVGTPGTTTLRNADLLTLDCDILIPAALGEVIHAGNVGDIRAKLIVEAANEPVTPDAEERIDAMAEAGDGFVIAEGDLDIRGPAYTCRLIFS